MGSSSAIRSVVNDSPEEWRRELDALPTLEQTGGKIPSIFLAHGQPMLLSSKRTRIPSIGEHQGPTGQLATFLRDLGPALIKKYSPKAIVVFSAHWETSGEIQVSDYGDENPLLMDYFGFDPEYYAVEFKSKGDSALSKHIVRLLHEHNFKAKTISTMDIRGEDGRGHVGAGLDHGVFVPFKLMFGDKTDIPIVQVSISSSLKPEDEWRLGAALEELRSQGVLIISGGLTIHTFRDFNAFGYSTAADIYKKFEASILDAAETKDPVQRKKELVQLINKPGFKESHPRAEHFITLYVAAGAADKHPGEARVLSGTHGAKTIAFGV